MVTEVDINEQDVMVEFLHPHGPQKNFKWLRNPDKCYVPIQNILCTIIISAPVTTTGRMYKISDQEYNNILSLFEKYLNSV